MSVFHRFFAPIGCLCLVSVAMTTSYAQTASFDVVIYGGTSAGVIAAVQSARLGRSAVLVEPSCHLGGLTSAGLGNTDIGNKKAVGGIALEFYQRICQHYRNNETWKHETIEEYRHKKTGAIEADSMWCFEPHVAEMVFRQMLAKAGVTVVLGERLDLINGVHKKDAAITSIQMESGRVFCARMFIDASYEGDLLAQAGVGYTIGREANAQYGETLNGVQTLQAKYHQFEHPVDPYIQSGNPQSGLLPGVHAGGPGEEGSADRRVQAYNFRMCLTDVDVNRAPFPKPVNYNSLQYELLLRCIEAGHNSFLLTDAIPNCKTDTNNFGAFSTDNIGMNHDYPDGDYATREKIIAEHRNYQLGLMWTLANHPRVPMNLRKHYGKWGLAKDEFNDNGNWPHQLYIREARRMLSDYVMTEHNCRGTRIVEDSVALGAFGIDSHHVQRYVDKQGCARNEGDVEVSGFSPYPISYKSIRPKAAECTNMLVPVCLSASHIAYGSIRMEPVFMVLGQSAATAATQAIEQGCDVQKIDDQQLRKQLIRDKQRLDWPP